MIEQTKVRDMERLVLRVPASVRNLLERRAKAQGRSMNAEAVAILEDALDSSPSTLKYRALEQYRQNLAVLAQAEAVREAAVARRDELRLVLLDYWKGDDSVLSDVENGTSLSQDDMGNDYGGAAR